MISFSHDLFAHPARARYCLQCLQADSTYSERARMYFEYHRRFFPFLRFDFDLQQPTTVSTRRKVA